VSPRSVRNRLASDDGISLVEMLVAMMLSGILLALVGTLFVNVARATSESNRTREAATVAGNIANELSKTIRFAVQNRVDGSVALDPAVVDAGESALTLLSLADADTADTAPAMVRFTLDGTQLVQQRWPGVDSAGFWVFDTTVVPPARSLGGDILPPAVGETALFTYFDVAGTELLPGPAGLTPEQRQRVASIAISLRVRSASSEDGPVAVVENTIGMPNLIYAGEDE
jgi:type II secretory pathway pseudopilin PulG